MCFTTCRIGQRDRNVQIKQLSLPQMLITLMPCIETVVPVFIESQAINWYINRYSNEVASIGISASDLPGYRFVFICKDSWITGNNRLVICTNDGNLYHFRGTVHAPHNHFLSN